VTKSYERMVDSGPIVGKNRSSQGVRGRSSHQVERRLPFLFRCDLPSATLRPSARTWPYCRPTMHQSPANRQ
jgi:hypothetical protein